MSKKKIIVITAEGDMINVSLRDSNLSYSKEIKPDTNQTSRELITKEFIANCVNTILYHEEAAKKINSEYKSRNTHL
jgi:DNA/RNA endonuclease YhcR with UshA esterase domain